MSVLFLYTYFGGEFMTIFHIGDMFFHKHNPLQTATITFLSSYPDSFGRYFYVLRIKKNNQYVCTRTDCYEIGIHSSLHDEWIPVKKLKQKII
jgi:hypothetical protein